MNKAEQREVGKAQKLAAMGEKVMAAKTLAILDRAAASARSRREIREVIGAEGLSHLLREVNGALVLATA